MVGAKSSTSRQRRSAKRHAWGPSDDTAVAAAAPAAAADSADLSAVEPFADSDAGAPAEPDQGSENGIMPLRFLLAFFELPISFVLFVRESESFHGADINLHWEDCIYYVTKYHDLTFVATVTAACLGCLGSLFQNLFVCLVSVSDVSP
jgi:hypothetical protein